MAGSRHEVETDGDGTRFGRGRLLAGAVGAGIASLLGRAKPAFAEDVPPANPPLLLGQENVAPGSTGLGTDASAPTLALRNQSGSSALVGSSLLSRQVSISQSFDGAALVGLGPSVGVLGHGALPAGGQFTQIGTPLPPSAGVAGLGSEHGFGVLGASILPRTTHISMTASGVAGLGERSGVEGRTALPRAMTISIPAGLGRGVSGVSDGLGVLGISRQTSISLTDESLLRAGAAGLGERLGVWGSAGPHVSAPVHITQVVGVLGTASGAGAAAIVAENEDGVALEVRGAASFLGPTSFRTGGSGVVRRDARRARVQDPTIRPDSLVNVTLTGDPGNAAAVHFVEVGDGVLDVVLTVPPRLDTRFNYFVYRAA